MADSKKVLMVMPHMIGGGAERVAAQLMNKLNERGWDTRFLLTRTKKDELVCTDLNEHTQLILLSEELRKESAAQQLVYFPLRIYSTVFGKLFEKMGKYVPASVGKASVLWQHHREIRWLKNYLLQFPDMSVIVFLQPAIPIVMLAAQKLPNRVLFSERGDPKRLMKKRCGRRFVAKFYARADAAVFQTQDAKAAYPEEIAKKGTVICNPVKADLPEPYFGERNLNITTFCRISKQKNLPLLLKAFSEVHKKHPEYTLRIIGDAANDEGKAVLQSLYETVSAAALENAVSFEPFTKKIHESVLKDAMYVNSSDYEGISNAMLESMAIGMPVVCTDCPIGGAKETIADGENGLLVPIGDAQALANAINRVIEDPAFAESLGKNASAKRDELSLDRIAARWEALL